MGPRVCFPKVHISGYMTGACPMSGNVIWGRWRATAVWVDHMKSFPCYLWVVSSLQMPPDTKVSHLTFTVLFPRTTAQWSTEHIPSTSWVNRLAFPPARNIFWCMQQISHQIIIKKVMKLQWQNLILKFLSVEHKNQACPSALPKQLWMPSTCSFFS